MKKKLYELAHSRAGDKGNTLIVSIIPYNEEDYPLLCERITSEKVKDHLKDVVEGTVIRYEVPNIAALQFVCQQALLGGVTTSLSTDTHGKSLSYALLEMEIDW
ncbi:AtuA-related protein [Bacillus sp. OTU2372]|uniref:AtuA-related protein n=1 Tax=Bacillus sp. OTU2372 TaxID=3043858 RepID=UPI00313EE923